MQRVMIFIHGGMNVSSQATERAISLLRSKEIEKSGYYPFFICWDSPFYGDWEQVLWVRAGRTERFGRGGFYAIATAPFQILADVGRAITRLPVEICAFGYNDLYSMRPDGFTEHSVMIKEYKKLNSIDFPPPKVGAQLGMDSRTFGDKLSRNVSAVVTAPVRAATHPL